MIELLSEKLAHIGLTLNFAKIKIVTTCTLQNPTVIQMGDVFLEVLVGYDVHKYLGKILTGHLRKRGRLEIAHRPKVCWGKFHEHAHILLNKHVSLQLRLKFLEGIITPTILYGMATTPTTKINTLKLDA